MDLIKKLLVQNCLWELGEGGVEGDVLMVVEVNRMGVFLHLYSSVSSLLPTALSSDVIVSDVREYRLFLGENRALVSFAGFFSTHNAL